MYRLTKVVVATLTALSVTLTPISVAAGSDGRDYARSMAELTGQGLFGRPSGTEGTRRLHQGSTYRNPYGPVEGRRAPRVIHGELYRGSRDGIRGRPRARSALLPGYCALTLTADRRDRTVFNQNCLKRNFASYDELPRDCRLKVRTYRGLRKVYDGRCLYRDGWRVAGY